MCKGMSWDFSVPWLLWPCPGGLFSQAVGVEALRFGLDQFLFPFIACPVPKEGIAEASASHALTEDQCATCVGVSSSTQAQPKITSLLLSYSSQIYCKVVAWSVWSWRWSIYYAGAGA